MCKWFPEHCDSGDVDIRGVVAAGRRVARASAISAAEIERVIAENPGWRGVQQKTGHVDTCEWLPSPS